MHSSTCCDSEGVGGIRCRLALESGALFPVFKVRWWKLEHVCGSPQRKAALHRLLWCFSSEAAHEVVKGSLWNVPALCQGGCGLCLCPQGEVIPLCHSQPGCPASLRDCRVLYGVLQLHCPCPCSRAQGSLWMHRDGNVNALIPLHA